MQFAHICEKITKVCEFIPIHTNAFGFASTSKTQGAQEKWSLER